MKAQAIIDLFRKSGVSKFMICPATNNILGIRPGNFGVISMSEVDKLGEISEYEVNGIGIYQGMFTLNI